MSSKFWFGVMIDMSEHIVVLRKVYDLLNERGRDYYWRINNLFDRVCEMYGQAELRERIWLVEEKNG